MTHPDSQSCVEHLKKVNLNLQVIPDGSQAEAPLKIEYIHGIGTCGLTPLELLVDGLGIGETRQTACPVKDILEFFGHLAPLALRLPPDNDQMLNLSVTVTSVNQPSDRDIVRGMAEMTRCGSCCGH